MFKKYLTLNLTVLVINLSLCSVAFAETKAEKDTKFAGKVKVNVTKLGTGTEAKIQVKLKDGTKLKGYVSQINENSFVVVDERTGAFTEVLYSQPKQIKGYNLNSGIKIAIGIGIVIILVLLLGHELGKS